MSVRLEETIGCRNRKLMALGPCTELPSIPTRSLHKDP